MASSSRLVLSLRRIRCSPGTLQRTSRIRPAAQVRWTGSTAATLEPYQPDENGGVKSGPAPAKAIKFTSDSYEPSL